MKQITVYINENRYSSNINKDNVDKYCDMPGMDEEVRTWYHNEYKNDPVWEDIEKNLKFSCALRILLDKNKETFDKSFGDDSIARERIFWHIVKLCKVTYDDLYNLWIR